MVLPEEGEILVCEHCGKETVATQNMDHWYCLSEVKGGEESSWIYLCSLECLKAHVHEPAELYFERITQDSNEAQWRIDELLILHNLLDRVEEHENMETCPLCGKEFVDGDSAVFFNGKPIHSECIEKLIDT